MNRGNEEGGEGGGQTDRQADRDTENESLREKERGGKRDRLSCLIVMTYTIFCNGDDDIDYIMGVVFFQSINRVLP